MKPYGSNVWKLSFDSIAQQITQVGRGQAQPMSGLPAGVVFPPAYKISPMACCKAFRKALFREPNLEADAMRRLDTDRCEDLFVNLQPGMRKGNPSSVDVGVKVLAHKAAINGYNAPTQLELAGKDGGNIPILLARKILQQVK